MRNVRGWMTLGVLGALVLALAPRAAKADGSPAFGYVHGTLGTPLGGSVSVAAPRFGAPWKTDASLGRRALPSLIERAGFGVGIGYDGLNAQLDVRNAGDLTNGLLTVGFRSRLNLGRLELWSRAGVGPQVAINYAKPSRSRVSGGLTVVAEAGLDFFVVEDVLAVGIKAVGAPYYTWEATFGSDFDVGLGLRLVL